MPSIPLIPLPRPLKINHVPSTRPVTYPRAIELPPPLLLRETPNIALERRCTAPAENRAAHSAPGRDNYIDPTMGIGILLTFHLPFVVLVVVLIGRSAGVFIIGILPHHEALVQRVEAVTTAASAEREGRLLAVCVCLVERERVRDPA